MTTTTYKKAVLIDTISIQKYVFAGSKLKEFIGASHIVAQEVFGLLDDTFLKKYCAEKVYDGGGNTMILFKKDKVSEFIKAYSKLVIAQYPGIKLAFGIADYNADWPTLTANLHASLNENKSHYLPIATVAHPGIVADCPLSGEPIEIYNKDIKQWISRSSAIKIKFAEKANLSLADKFTDKLKYTINEKSESYNFPTEFNQLGQDDGKGYIAIVHIDGNGMGQKFIESTSKEYTKALSSKLDAKNKAAIDKLIGHISTDLMQELTKYDSGFTLKDNLPIRPLIIGGDDFTFVCDARLAVYFANYFITELKIDKGHGVFEEIDLEACAGIAIVKTKFPFLRAYEEAERLLKLAKTKAKLNLGTATGMYKSYIAWNIINTAVYDTPDVAAYSVNDTKDKLEDLLNIVKIFQEQWSMSEVMRLRDALHDGTYSSYKKVLESKQEYLFKKINVKKEYQLKDAIDLMDFYPYFL